MKSKSQKFFLTNECLAELGMPLNADDRTTQMKAEYGDKMKGNIL